MAALAKRTLKVQDPKLLKDYPLFKGFYNKQKG